MSTTARQPLYHQIADRYLNAMAAGTLAPGHRMPSVRDLMRLHDISLSTALQAYRQLERCGVLEARPRSGYFVRRQAVPARRSEPLTEPKVTLPDPAQFVGVHARVSSMIDSRERLPVRLNMAGAIANPALYSTRELKAAATRVLRHQPALFGSAAPARGLPMLRSELARRALATGMQLGADDVLITYGATEALNLALRAVAGPGDVIAVESPAYYGLLQILEGLGMRALEIPTSPLTGISLEALELAASTYEQQIKAVVVVPVLQNPLGCIMPDAHKRQLLSWCERRGIALIEDDVYGPLVETETPPMPIKALDRDGGVIHCASLRKCAGAGLRIGWISGGRWHERIAALKYTQTYATDALTQAVLADTLTSGAFDRQIKRLKIALSTRRELARDVIAREFPHGTRLNVPSGGFTFWIELPAPASAERAYVQALDLGLLISPGTIFSNTARFDRHLRINFAAPSDDELEPALRDLARAVEKALRLEGPSKGARAS